jgi:hypothetical protein
VQGLRPVLAPCQNTQRKRGMLPWQRAGRTIQHTGKLRIPSGPPPLVHSLQYLGSPHPKSIFIL